MGTINDLQSLDPRWLAQPMGAAWRRASLNQKATILDRTRRALKMRFAELAPADAQALIGGERQIERGPQDTTATYGHRIVDAWNLWQWSGTAFGLLTALSDIGYPSAVIEIVNGWEYSLSSGQLVIVKRDPGSWHVDGDASFWSKFDIIFPSNPWSDDPANNDPRIVQIRRVVRTWKSRLSTPGYLIVILAGRLLGFPRRALGSGMLGACNAQIYSL
jgi:hypothetical protein